MAVVGIDIGTSNPAASGLRGRGPRNHPERAKCGKASGNRENTAMAVKREGNDERGTRRLRVAIADDDPTVLDEIGGLLGTCFDVVARAENGRALVAAVREFSPDVVVADVSMPEMNGIQAARAITNECPGVKVVMLSIHDETEYVDAAFEAGASGYVLKIRGSQELIPAIEAVVAGRSYRPPQTMDSL